MRAEFEDWNNGWFGVSLGLSVAEIDRFIALLAKLRTDPDQHFHISSDYAGTGGLGGIEIYVQAPGEVSNMSFRGLAMGSGDDSQSA